MLNIEGVKKVYGEKSVLDNITLSVNEASVYTLLGENASGKTTLLKVIGNLIPFDQGHIYINEINIKKMSNKERTCIAYMPEKFAIYDKLKVYEYMEFYASLYGFNGKRGKILVDELLNRMKLEDCKNQYVDPLEKEMKQKLSLGRCLIHNPSLLILDEPFAGIDISTRNNMESILEELQKEGKTIIITSNLLSPLPRITTHMGVLHKGKMKMDGKLNDILNSKQLDSNLNIEVLDDIDKTVLLLKKNKLVQNIIIQENLISVMFIGNEYEEAELLHKLSNEDIMIRSFKREISNMEHIIMSIRDES